MTKSPKVFFSDFLSACFLPAGFGSHRTWFYWRTREKNKTQLERSSVNDTTLLTLQICHFFSYFFNVIIMMYFSVYARRCSEKQFLRVLHEQFDQSFTEPNWDWLFLYGWLFSLARSVVLEKINNTDQNTELSIERLKKKKKFQYCHSFWLTACFLAVIEMSR